MRIGATYFGGDRELLERLLPVVDFIETTPDSIARIRNGRAAIPDETRDELRLIARERKLLLHGVGLSIASHDGYDRDYLALLDELFSLAGVAWHSEHLGYTRVDGQPLGTMLVPPRTEEVIAMISERAAEVREGYDAPFLVENVVNLLPEHPQNDCSPARFLNEIATRSGCGLILDIYNLECEMHNQRLDVEAFLHELEFAHVRELHIANGVSEQGLMLDVHSRRPRPETLALADRIVPLATNAEVLVYEVLPQAVPALGHDAIVNELTMLRERYGAAAAGDDGPTLRAAHPPRSLAHARDDSGAAALQRGLAALVRGEPAPADDAYLTTIAESTGLAVTRNVIASWRELLLRQASPLTFALLDQRGRTAAALASLAGEATPSFVEQLAPLFLEGLVDDDDALLAAVARFERAVVLVRQGALASETVVWPHPPAEVVQRLLAREPVDGLPVGEYEVVVATD